MAKLCYKIGGNVKKYDLKDNVNKPRLAVKSGGQTKYLGLKQGTKSGELQVKVGGLPYYVQTWDPEEQENWNITPYKGTLGAGQGNTSFGGCAVWALTYNGRLAFILGMMSADKPEDWARAVWEASKDSNINITDTDCGTPCIRLATIPFGVGSSSSYYRAVPSTIYDRLTDPQHIKKRTDLTTYYANSYVGWGEDYIDTPYSSLPSSKRKTEIEAFTPTSAGQSKGTFYYRIVTGNDSSIYMRGESDDGGAVVGDWATRCFLVEYPAVINTGKTPRQILDIWKALMENNNVYSTDFGTCYGRNYPTADLRQ